MQWFIGNVRQQFNVSLMSQGLRGDVTEIAGVRSDSREWMQSHLVL